MFTPSPLQAPPLPKPPARPHRVRRLAGLVASLFVIGGLTVTASWAAFTADQGDTVSGTSRPALSR